MARLKPKGFWRIKDIETGLYYSRKWIMIDKEQGYKKDNFTHWDELGDVWMNKGSAERVVTQITRIEKAKRDNNAKIVLYGNKEAAKIRVVEATVTDKED